MLNEKRVLILVEAVIPSSIKTVNVMRIVGRAIRVANKKAGRTKWDIDRMAVNTHLKEK